jgi:hypothetical protein
MGLAESTVRGIDLRYLVSFPQACMTPAGSNC